MTKLALSTMWGIGKYPTVNEFIAAGKELGFTRFELNHAVDSAMLAGFAPNDARIVSVHEPCPADISPSELRKRDWLISACDEDNRQRGVLAVKRSIDLAHQLGVSVIVVHAGSVPLARPASKVVEKLFQAEKINTPEFFDARANAIASRAMHIAPSFAAVQKSIVELIEYARPRGVTLGLEVRKHYHEIPSPDEMQVLLNLGDTQAVGYWHDVGHAQAWEELGYYAHQEWLRRFASRMVGIHLHDMIGFEDHHAAGLGKINLAMVAQYIPANIVRTCEFQNFNSPDQVRAGVRSLAECGCARGD